MSIEKLTKTIIYTELANAIKTDFDIELPKYAGPETIKVINEIAKLLVSSESEST